MLTDNRGKSDISSLSAVSIFKAIKSDPRRARSWAVVATATDCTRDLHGASLRRCTRRIGRENRMNCSLHGEMRQGHCSGIRDETERTNDLQNELDESTVPWSKEMTSCVLAFLTRLHAPSRGAINLVIRRHSMKLAPHCHRTIVNTRNRTAHEANSC